MVLIIHVAPSPSHCVFRGFLLAAENLEDKSDVKAIFGIGQ